MIIQKVILRHARVELTCEGEDEKPNRAFDAGFFLDAVDDAFGSSFSGDFAGDAVDDELNAAFGSCTTDSVNVVAGVVSASGAGIAFVSAAAAIFLCGDSSEMQRFQHIHIYP